MNQYQSRIDSVTKTFIDKRGESVQYVLSEDLRSLDKKEKASIRRLLNTSSDWHHQMIKQDRNRYGWIKINKTIDESSSTPNIDNVIDENIEDVDYKMKKFKKDIKQFHQQFGLNMEPTIEVFNENLKSLLPILKIKDDDVLDFTLALADYSFKQAKRNTALKLKDYQKELKNIKKD